MGKAMTVSKILIIAFSLAVFSSSSSAGANIISQKDSLKVGDAAPYFGMRELNTDTVVYLRDYTGKVLREPANKRQRHVMVLSFWATYCQPCKNEIPILSKLAEQFKDQPVKILLINTLEMSEQTEDSVRDVYQTRGYTLTCLFDATRRYAELYSVRVLPVMIVIDKFGIVRHINRGYHENFQIELEKLLKELVEEQEPIKK
jgi:thiol-disulfide isomerase/thioredoxin